MTKSAHWKNTRLNLSKFAPSWLNVLLEMYCEDTNVALIAYFQEYYYYYFFYQQRIFSSGTRPDAPCARAALFVCVERLEMAESRDQSDNLGLQTRVRRH